MVSIIAYNSAGEVVKIIAASYLTGPAVSAEIRMNGSPTDSYPGGEGELEIVIPGVKSPGHDSALFTWDGTSENGQKVTSGTYHLQIATQDRYGHTDTIVEELFVLEGREKTEIRIYNSAGELVRVLEGSAIPASAVSLEVEEVALVGKTAPGVIIEYGSGMNTVWDGKNNMGIIVASGMYEVQVVVNDANAITIYAVQSMMVLQQDGVEAISDVKLLPNPVVITGAGGASQRITWIPGQAGTADIRIYNIAGEAIRSLAVPLLSGTVTWDLLTDHGKTAAGGVYLIVITARAADGTIQNTKIKSAIMIRTDSQDETVN